MSLLSSSLELILPAIRECGFSELADSFLPGLPREEIRAMLEGLGIPCPDELIDLYHWRNGTPLGTNRYGFPPEFIFLPLEEVIENYVTYYQEADALQALDTMAWNYAINKIENALLPLGIHENHKMLPFTDHGELYFYSMVVSSDNAYIMLDHQEDGSPKPYFDSLTSMVQTLLASYEERAYYPLVDGDIIDLGVVPELFKSILQKYNPITSKFVLPDIDEWLII
jgi:hypothetical protein